MSRRAAVNEKQGRHSSHFALVRFAMMTTCLDLAAELLSALIAGHEERAEVREERRGAGGHVKALGGSALATPSRWPRWSRAITHQSIARATKCPLFARAARGAERGGNSARGA